ncbi:MAG: hypothetical protein KBT55_04935 [Porticoccus sp.]|nr:hypothetical protein [Porticoccus sp.]
MGIAAIMFGIPAWIVLGIIAFLLIKKGIAKCDPPMGVKISKFIHPSLIGYVVSTIALIIVAAIAEDISMDAQINSLIFAFIFPMMAGFVFVASSAAGSTSEFMGWWVNRFGVGFYLCTLFLPVTVYIMHKALVYRAILQAS